MTTYRDGKSLMATQHTHIGLTVPLAILLLLVSVPQGLCGCPPSPDQGLVDWLATGRGQADSGPGTAGGGAWQGVWLTPLVYPAHRPGPSQDARGWHKGSGAPHKTTQGVFDYSYRDYVLSWYVGLSKDEGQLYHMLSEDFWEVAKQLRNRLSHIDVVRVVCIDSVKILHTHFYDLKAANTSQKGGSTCRLRSQKGRKPCRLRSQKGRKPCRLRSQKGRKPCRLRSQKGRKPCRLRSQKGRKPCRLRSQKGRKPCRLRSQKGRKSCRLRSLKGGSPAAFAA
ncbi:UNVERIFIED_CONTAM: hypothetical protein FKN15_059370 [Acipenser sinensis]